MSFDRGCQWRLAAVMLTASACAPAPRTGAADRSATPPSASASAADYPPTFRYYGGATLSARVGEIARDLGVDSDGVVVDPLGCVHSLVFTDASRVPVDAGDTESFSEREMKAWSKFFAAHRDAFCIPRGERPQVQRVPDAPRQVRVGAEQRIRVTKYAEVGPDGKRRDLVRVDGNMWKPQQQLPAPRIDVDSVVRDLVDRPFTLRLRAHGIGPHCQGCAPTPPDLDLGSVETTAALEDFATEGPTLQLVCGRSSVLELRHVLVVEFQPSVEDVTRRTRRRRTPAESMPNYRVDGIVPGAKSSFPTRIVDAVTGEPIPRQGWRFEQEPWRPELCGADS